MNPNTEVWSPPLSNGSLCFLPEALTSWRELSRLGWGGCCHDGHSWLWTRHGYNKPSCALVQRLVAVCSLEIMIPHLLRLATHLVQKRAYVHWAVASCSVASMAGTLYNRMSLIIVTFESTEWPSPRYWCLGACNIGLL